MASDGIKLKPLFASFQTARQSRLLGFVVGAVFAECSAVPGKGQGTGGESAKPASERNGCDRATRNSQRLLYNIGRESANEGREIGEMPLKHASPP